MTGNVVEASISELQIKEGTINVATVREKEEELVEVVKTRGLDLLSLSETRLKAKKDRIMHENYRMIQ